jgi:hypothetical protein
MARLRQKWLRQWFSDRKEKKIKSAHAPILAPMRLWRPDRNGPDQYPTKRFRTGLPVL